MEKMKIITLKISSEQLEEASNLADQFNLDLVNLRELDEIESSNDEVVFLICDSFGVEIIDEIYHTGATAIFSGKKAVAELKEFLRPEKTLPLGILTNNITYNKDLQKIIPLWEQKETSLLLRGESGVGKTHLIKTLNHQLTPTSPIMMKNLSELNEETFHSELFGHVKGSFTGATNDKTGLIEKSHGGILFLDEIATLSLKQQKALLKVLEEKEFTPLGANKKIKISFKLICATCENLEQLVETGKMRKDFYFRIRGQEVNIPPLSERPEDIELLLNSLISKSSKKLHFTKEAKSLLQKHQFNGNLRELKNIYNILLSRKNTRICDKDINDVINQKTDSYKEKSFTNHYKREDNEKLPDFINRIQMEEFKRVSNETDKGTNQLCRLLGISKSVYYRLLEQCQTNVHTKQCLELVK